MKKIFLVLLLINLAFSYSFKEMKEIINSNSPKIDTILKSKDAIYLLEAAIYLNRFDLVKKALKQGFDFNTKDEEGNTLLNLASFLAKPKFIEFLIDKINPNELNNKGTNSLTMLIAGINQEYPFVFSKDYVPKEKDKKSFEEYKKKIKENIIKSADILRKNYAKSEYSQNDRLSTFVLFRNYIERYRDKKPVNKELTNFLLNHYLNKKQKMFLYFILGEDKKGKEILEKNIEFLKEPYYLDFKYHFLYLLAKINRLDIARYMVELAKKNQIDLINYRITSKYTKNIDSLVDSKWAEDFWDLVKNDFKPKKDIFDLIYEEKYDEIKKFSKNYFLNTIEYVDLVDINQPFKYTSPLLTAIYLKNKKMVKLLLKNGLYVSGWNKIHYKILKGEKLNLSKFPKWQRVYLLNQPGLLNGLTPLDISIMYDKSYIDILLKNGAKVNKKSFSLAIRYNLEEKLKSLIKEVSYDNLKDLALKGKIDYLRYLFDKGLIDKYKLEYLDEKLSNTKYYNKFFKTFKKELLQDKCSNLEIKHKKPFDLNLTKECLKNGYEFDDKKLIALFMISNKELMPYLLKYKNKKFFNKYYPLFYISKKEYLKDFITPKSKSQLDFALCKISLKEKKRFYK